MTPTLVYYTFHQQYIIHQYHRYYLQFVHHLVLSDIFYNQFSFSACFAAAKIREASGLRV